MGLFCSLDAVCGQMRVEWPQFESRAGGKMKIRIPDKIMTEQGEVKLLPYNSGTAYMRGLIDGWKAAICKIRKDVGWDKPEFLEIGEDNDS